MTVSWSGVDLADLQSLAIQHPAGIEVSTALDSQEISLSLETDIQAEGHEELAQLFKQAISDQSVWSGQTPRISVPEPSSLHPSYACFESQGASPEDPAILRGICVRELRILLPAKKLLELDLSWKGQALIRSVETPLMTLRLPEDGSLRIHRLRGRIQLRGGGIGASAIIDKLLPGSNPDQGIRGDIQARLSRVGRMELRDVMGSIYVALEQPAPSTVTVDGKAVERFPFHRP